MAAIRRVAFCVLVRDGKGLLAHRHPARVLYPDVWDVPGGHIEPGETPEQAARRELAEEIGVKVLDLEPVPVRVDVPGAETHPFVSLRWVGEPTNMAPDEYDELAWFAPADLVGLRLAVPEVAVILRVAVATADRRR